MEKKKSANVLNQEDATGQEGAIQAQDTGKIRDSALTDIFLPVIIVSHDDDKAGPTARYWSELLKTILHANLRRLGDLGFQRVLVYGTSQSESLLDPRLAPPGLQVDTLRESIAEGNAGFLREVFRRYRQDYFLVCQHGVLLQSNITDLLQNAYEQSAALTVLVDADAHQPGSHTAAGVYICSRQISGDLSPAGYYDLKENLIPDLLLRGKEVGCLKNEQAVLNVSHWQVFLARLPEILPHRLQPEQTIKKTNDGLHSLHPSATIKAGARLCGPVMVCENAVIEENALLIGPVVVGSRSVIGSDTLVTDSIVGENCMIRGNSFIEKSMVESHSIIHSDTPVRHRIVTGSQASGWNRSESRRSGRGPDDTSHRAAVARPAGLAGGNPVLFFYILLVGALLWSYWPTVQGLWTTWMQTDEYSSGLLVPIIAVYVAWIRREQFGRTAVNASIAGLLLFIAAQLIRSYGFLASFNSLLNYSLWMGLVGLTLWMFGWRITWKSATVFLFLLLAFPLPKLLENRITLPLQSFATDSAVFLLELFNYNVLQEGNVLHLGDATVAVAEACNGLRMITAFFVINALVAFLINRSIWTKVVVVLSSLPIAIGCNTIRLVLTAIAFKYITGEQWQTIFHDFGGYAMMPLALLMVIGELWLIDKLWQPGTADAEEAAEPVLIIKNRG